MTTSNEIALAGGMAMLAGIAQNSEVIEAICHRTMAESAYYFEVLFHASRRYGFAFKTYGELSVSERARYVQGGAQ